MRKTFWFTLLAFTILCLILTGCGREGTNGGQDNGAGKEEQESGRDKADERPGPAAVGYDKEDGPSGPVEAGDDYRDFTALMADGSTFTLSEHEGSVILLNFWATWCGPCVREMPAFPRLVEKYGDDLTLIAVNVGETEQDVKAFLEKNSYGFSVGLDTEGGISALYPTEGIPYTILIGRDGRIASIYLGADKADVMFEVYCGEIDGLLEGDGPDVP